MKWKLFWEKLTNWERWPFQLRYLPITPVWLYYCIRARSFWFFTASNPTITFGGFEGEGKKEMYQQLPKHLYPKTVFITPETSFETVLACVKHSFQFPFCVKPDVGMKGLLFRKIDNEDELRDYHRHMPVEYMVQELVRQPMEVSVFYYRFPWSEKGVITGFIQKDLMEVVGDGQKTLLHLIEEHPNARHRLGEMRTRHHRFLHERIPAGERYILTYAANLNRGATFLNLSRLIDEQLLGVFDKISHQTSFYYGRYDLKCDSVEELKKGNFSILEFNGSGAEPNHVYQTGYSWLQALSVFLYHWKVLYTISVYNHRKGVPYRPFRRGWAFLREARKHFTILEKADKEILV